MSSNSGRCRRFRSSESAWSGRGGTAALAGRVRVTAGVAAVAEGLAAGLVVARTDLPGVALLAGERLAAFLAGERLAAARFGAADRFAVFLEAFARLLAARAGFAMARFFRAEVLAERRVVAWGGLRFVRVAARRAAGRFLAFLAMTV